MIKRIPNRPAGLLQDPFLLPYHNKLIDRSRKIKNQSDAICTTYGSLKNFASAHEYLGLHRNPDGSWVFREWAPLASGIVLFGDFSNWEKLPEYRMVSVGGGVWEISLPADTLCHGMNYLMHVYWNGGSGDRIPAYARRVVQDDITGLFSAMVWQPDEPYRFRYSAPERSGALLIYEVHVGMAQEDPVIGSFLQFKENILPKIAQSGYNTIQFMAIMGHPYYGSFGYHVANFFAVSDKFGTPEEFKNLIDEAHRLGLRVIIDLVHSHAVKNEVEGIGRIDGTSYAYFHSGLRGVHDNWDSLCFDYGKKEVLQFLLSNCRYYLDEFKIDGFRFDGVTSMMYLHHGLGRTFTGYSDYFDNSVDDDAITYLALANRLIHEINPQSVTVAEDVSGMPGLTVNPDQCGGIGFDYRLAMGVTDMWFKLLDIPDEHWNMFYLFGELTNQRQDEQTISYVECHDQAIVGGKTAIFTMADKHMYNAMHIGSNNVIVDRAIALHKLMRLASASCAGYGYMNFMGNEFGHPEWIDFPREGNNWSYERARRLWHLSEDKSLRFSCLHQFDLDMLKKILLTDGFYQARVQQIKIDDQSKVLIFERNDLWFCFNFHPTQSYCDYAFEASKGEYETVLDSDDIRYNGFGNREPGQVYYTHWMNGVMVLELYLPSRSALVLRKKRAGQGISLQ